MKKSNALRLLSVILTIVMVLSAMPFAIFAADGCEHPSVTDDNKCTVCDAEMKAKVTKSDATDIYFESVETALAALQGTGYYGATLTLFGDYSSDIEVSSGNFRLNAGEHTVSGNIYIKGSAVFSITGGTFSGNIEAFGGSSVYLSGGTYTGTLKSHVKYDGFNLDNISVSGKVIADEKGCGFRINRGVYTGEIILSGGADVITSYSGNPEISTDCVVTVSDENNDGTYFSVETGTFYGAVNVLGGTFKVDGYARIANLNVAEEANVSLSGGTYFQINCTGEKTLFDLLEKRYVFISAFDADTVVPCKDVSSLSSSVKVVECPDHSFDENNACPVCYALAEALVIASDGTTTTHDYFGDAMSYAQTLSGVSTVKLFDDVYTDTPVTIMSGDGIVLDMDGKTFYDTSAGYDSCGIITAKNLTVTGNGTMNGYLGVMAVSEDMIGELTIENGTFNSFVAAMGASKVNINGGTFNEYVYAQARDESVPELKFNGGNFKMIFINDADYNWYSALGENKGYETDSSEMFKSFSFQYTDVFGFDGTENGTMLSVVDHTKHNYNDNNICIGCGAEKPEEPSTEPTEPSEPTKPSEPTEPSEPENPTEPTTEPSDSSNASKRSFLEILRDFFTSLFKLIRQIVEFFTK